MRASREEMMEDHEVASRYVSLCVPYEGAHLGIYKGKGNVTIGLYT